MKAMKVMKAKKPMRKAAKKPMKAKKPMESMKAMKKAMKTKTPGPRNIMQELQAVGLDGYCLTAEKAIILREICNSVHHLRRYMHVQHF